MPRFKVILREKSSANNPFYEHAAFERGRTREWEIEATGKEQVKELFAEAQAQNLPNVQGFNLAEITEL